MCIIHQMAKQTNRFKVPSIQTCKKLKLEDGKQPMDIKHTDTQYTEQVSANGVILYTAHAKNKST